MKVSPRLALLFAAVVPVAFHACTSREVVGVVVQEVVVNPDAATVTVGDSLRLTAVVQDDRGVILRSAKPEWASSGEAVAVVDADGMVRGIRAGTVVVTASYGNVTDTATITVTPPPVFGFAVLETAGSTIVTEGGGLDELSVVLLVQPVDDVMIDIESADLGEVEVDVTRLVFTPGDWSDIRTVTVLGVADGVVDGDRATEVTLSVDPASDAYYAGLPPRVVRVTSLDAESAGFTVEQTGGSTRVDEGVSSDTLFVSLHARPASDVVLSVQSADPAEVVPDPVALTFTPTDWDSVRTVVVSGVADDQDDGDRITPVTVSVMAEASDALWHGLPEQVVEVESLDGVPGLRITETDGSTVVHETGTEDTFTVALTRAPSTDVRLRVTVSDDTEVRSDTETLTFGPRDWNEPRAVRLTGVDDDWVDGPQVSVVTIEVLPDSDAAWLGQVEEILVPTVDDEVAALVIVETKRRTVVEEDGEKDKIRVRLSGRPESDVLVTVVSTDTTEVVVEPTLLRFTPSNWDDWRDVTVIGVDDELIDGSTFTPVVFTVDPTSAPPFARLEPYVVIVENRDDDPDE